MKKIILNIIVCQFLILPLFGQTGNELSGTDAGININSYDDYNTAFGDYSLSSSSIRGNNTAFGAYAGYQSTYYTVSLGYNTGSPAYVYVDIGTGLYHNYTNTSNTCIGHNILTNSTSMSFGNVLIGDQAGYNISDVDYSTIIGNKAGFYNSNVMLAIGHYASHYTTGTYNTAIGNYAEGYGSGAAGYGLTSGEYNVLMGGSAGSNLGTANSCTFIGTGAGGNTFGKDYNTFVGGLAGYNTGAAFTVGDATNNVLVGYKAGYTNIGGDDNVVVGYNADFSDTSYINAVMIGANNVASADDITLVGYGSTATADNIVGVGREVSVNGLEAIGVGYQTNISSAGAYSISLGHQSSMTETESIGIGYLSNIQSSEVVAIGSDATVSGATATLLGASNTISGSNSTTLGYNISIANDNQINIGNDAVMSISGIVNWTTTSDGRLKTNDQEDISGLEFIMKLRPVTYQLTVDGERQTANGRRFTGFIAQEVEQAALEIGYDFSGIDKPTGNGQLETGNRYGLRYAQFTVPLVKAVQELSQSQADTSNTIQQTIVKTTEIDALLESLNARLEGLESEH